MVPIKLPEDVMHLLEAFWGDGMEEERKRWERDVEK